MEPNAIEWNTIFIFVLFNIDAVWVVRTHLMQRQNVQYHERKQHDW